MGSLMTSHEQPLTSHHHGEGRGSFLFLFSAAKSPLKGTINTERLIVALPPPRTPTGYYPCLDIITGVPAISSVVASSITV